MPSAKESGVELVVGCGRGELLAVGGTDGVGVTAGVMTAEGEGVGVTVGAGVGIGAWGGVGGRWHWQSKKTVAPRILTVTKRRKRQRASLAIDLPNAPRCVESSVFPGWTGLLS
jgi:hypothetical protein